VLLASLVRCRTGTQTRACAVEFKQGASLDVDAAFESSESPRKMGHLEKERQAEMAHETRHADSKEELHRLLQCLALQMEACSEIIQIAQHRTISQLACRCFAMWAHFLQQQTLQTETTFEKQRFHHVRVMQRARLEGFFETSRCRIVGDLECRCFAVWLHVSKQRMLISRLEPVVEVAHRNMVSELACRCFGVWAYHTRQKILSMQAMADLDQHKETILQHKAEIDQHKAEVDRHKERERQLRDALIARVEEFERYVLLDQNWVEPDLPSTDLDREKAGGSQLHGALLARDVQAVRVVSTQPHRNHGLHLLLGNVLLQALGSRLTWVLVQCCVRSWRHVAALDALHVRS